MALGFIITAFLFVGLYALVPATSQEVALPDRLRVAIECLVFPTVFLLAMILRIGSQRFGNPSEDPTKVVANTESMAVDLRVLSNTHEQIVIFATNVLALSVLLPFQYLSLLPIYSGVFVAGRIVFWMAYQHNVLWRAPGFAMSTLPAVVGLGYCCTVIALRAFS